MLRHLPNALTTLRLLLSLPLGLLILDENYAGALLVGIAAGVTDALDGYAARRLDSHTQLGAMLDPIADKLLITVTFLSLAYTGLASWVVAAVVVGRDLVIISGALAYRLMVGPVHFAATALSKFNTALQIGFCVLALSARLLPGVTESAITGASFAVVLATLLSGLDYVLRWAFKARRALREPGV